MSAPDDPTFETLYGRLEHGERVEVVARATGALLAVTDQRLIVTAGQRIALSVPFHNLRRIQFDVERTRPATFVIVPEDPADEPQVLGIPADEIGPCAQAIVILGQRLTP